MKNVKKFSFVNSDIQKQQRSKSFSKPCKKKHRKQCKNKSKKSEESKSGRSRHTKHSCKSKHSGHSRHRHKHHKHRHQCSKKHKHKHSHKDSNSSESKSRTPVMHARGISNQQQIYKSVTPKMGLRRNYLADNLKLKAEELIQRRVDRERRKNTEDINLEKLVPAKNDHTYETEEAEDNPFSYSMKKIHRPHKESMAKPLTEDSEDESPYSRKNSPNKYYKDMRVSENISRLMDDKRSTIKEQIEDEEEFTGSSLNISGNLHFIHASKKCKKQRESGASNASPQKDSEPHSMTSKRKYSDPNYKSDSTPPINVGEKPRKFTDNFNDMAAVKHKQKPKKTTDHENSTTIGGTSAITPWFRSKRDSGFEDYAASMISTPVMSKAKANRQEKE